MKPLLLSVLLAALVGCQSGETHAVDEPKGVPIAHTADGKIVPPGVPGSTR